MTATVNPVNMNVGDTSAAAQGVTAFKVLLGTQSGGPYTAAATSVALSAMTDNAGVYTVAMAALTWNPPLQNGVTYFAVCEAENAGGLSPNSPEASFQMVSAPTAPTSLSFV